MIYYITAILITVFSLFLSWKLFKQKIPMYYKMPIGFVCCFALQQLSYVVNEICGSNFYGDPGVGALGIFGGFCFLLSANYGQIDSIVDDGLLSSGARKTALAAPAIDLLLIAALVITLNGEISLFNKIMYVAILLPILPASYFCLKHLLLPTDDFGFLRSSRLYNFAVLVEGVLFICYLRVLLSDNDLIKSICSAAISLSVFCLVLSCVKGVKIWKHLF